MSVHEAQGGDWPIDGFLQCRIRGGPQPTEIVEANVEYYRYFPHQSDFVLIETQTMVRSDGLYKLPVAISAANTGGYVCKVKVVYSWGLKQAAGSNMAFVKYQGKWVIVIDLASSQLL
jgi:hypothetical protein